MFDAKQVHCGQYKPYGDFFRVWKIETDMTREELIEKCFTVLYKRRLPEEKEWRENIRYGEEHFGDMNYYFRGYYSLEKIGNIYEFTICEPFAD